MTNTLPRTGCFSRNASADKFRGGNDASARKGIAALTIEGTVLLTRYSPLGFRGASARRRWFLTSVEIEGIFQLWMPAGPQGTLPTIPS